MWIISLKIEITKLLDGFSVCKRNIIAAFPNMKETLFVSRFGNDFHTLS